LGDAKSLSDLGEDFGAGLQQTEVDYLLAQEFAITAEDILWRRSKLGLTFPKENLDRLADYLENVRKANADSANLFQAAPVSDEKCDGTGHALDR
jgi:glycerol-3-phosphate dehydrogenase